MKKYFIAIILSLVANGVISNAQEIPAGIQPGMKYKQLKKIYNQSDALTFNFTDKPKYNVGGLSAASFFIPGLGQFIAGEKGLGCAFLFPWLVSGPSLYFAGSLLLFSGIYESGATAVAMITSGITILTIMAGSMLAIDIVSAINAAFIARVKNMYYDDLKRLSSDISFDIKLSPYMDVLATHSSNYTPVAGLSFKLTF